MVRTLFATALIALSAPAAAQEAGERPVRIVEEVPRLEVARVARSTPSGLPVPRWVSLKTGRANCRIGPSRDHRVLYQFRRRGMPVVVVAETEQWRRVRDVNGDLCWVKGSGLSGERRALAVERVELRAKPKAEAKLRAVAERGAVLELGECREGWCEARAEGFKGWARRDGLWGAEPL